MRNGETLGNMEEKDFWWGFDSLIPCSRRRFYTPSFFYFVSAKIKLNSKLAEDMKLIMKYITINLDLSTV